MSLEIGNAKSQFQTRDVIIVKVRVADIEDNTLVGLPFLERSPDVLLSVKCDIGKDFTPTMNFWGNYSKDSTTGAITGWGSAIVVNNFLWRVGVEGKVGDDGKIPQEILDQCRGKEFWRLSYVSGTKKDGEKVKYQEWNEIGSLEEGPENLLERFRYSLTKGYPKNYRSDLAEKIVQPGDVTPF